MIPRVMFGYVLLPRLVQEFTDHEALFRLTYEALQQLISGQRLVQEFRDHGMSRPPDIRELRLAQEFRDHETSCHLTSLRTSIQLAQSLLSCFQLAL
jgi:hypothetical protein